MKINLKIRFGHQVSIQEREPYWKITLTEPPKRGKANKQLIQVLADYFKVPENRVRILSGARSRRKVVEILNKS